MQTINAGVSATLVLDSETIYHFYMDIGDKHLTWDFKKTNTNSVTDLIEFILGSAQLTPAIKFNLVKAVTHGEVCGFDCQY